MAVIDAADVRISASTDGLKAGLAQATAAVKDAAEKMKGDMGGLSAGAVVLGTAIGTAIGGMAKELIAGIGAAVASLLDFSRHFDAVLKQSESARELGAIFGVNRDKALALSQAASNLNISQEELTRTSRGLEAQIKSNESGLNKLGLATKDGAGKQRQLTDIMADAVALTQQYEPGAARAAATMYIFGRATNDVSKFMGMTKEAIAAASDENDQLNLSLGKEGVANAYQYALALDNIGDVTQGISLTIGQTLMPTFTAFLNWLASFGPSVIDKIAIGMQMLAGVFETVGLAIYAAGRTIYGVIEAISESFGVFGRALWALVTGDVKGAYVEMTRGVRDVGTTIKKTFEDVVAAGTGAWGRLTSMGKKTPIEDVVGGGKAWNKPGQAKTKDVEASEMKNFEVQLNEEKRLYLERSRQQETFLEMDIATERKFWQAKLEVVRAGSKDYEAIKEKLNAIRRREIKDQFDLQMAEIKSEEREAGKNEERKLAAIQREKALIIGKFGANSNEARTATEKEREAGNRALAQKQEIENLKEKAARDRIFSEIQLEQEEAQLQLEMGKITNVRMLELERDFERRRFEIKRAAAVAAREEVDPAKDPVEYQKRLNQIEEIERDHRAKVADMRRKEIKLQSEEEKEARRISEQGFQQFFEGLLSGNKSVKESFSDLLKFIEQEVLKLISQRLARQLADSLFGGIGQGGGGTFGSGGGGGMMSFLGNLFGFGSGTGSTGGVSSGSGGDIWGQVASGLIGSFAVGTPYVPRDMLAVIHKGEAIIPAHMNHGGHVGGSTVINNNFHLATPADPRTQTQIAHLAAQASSRAMRRNG